MNIPAASRSGFDATRVGEELRSSWGWLVALGVVLLLLGFVALANLFVATVVSVLYIGVLMLIGGVGQIITAFRIRKSGSFWLWLVSGLLYAAAGVFAFYNPALAAQVLTVLLAVSMIAAGLGRIGIGVRKPRMRGWGWVVASGVLSILVGMIVFAGWLFASLFILGLVLAIDLTFLGMSTLLLGLAVRSPESSQAHAEEPAARSP